MNKGIDEQELLQRLSDLPREIAPRRDVWPDILSRIDRNDAPVRERTPDRLWPRFAVAAGFLVAFAAGLMLGPRLLVAPADPFESNGQAVAQADAPEFPSSLPALLAATEMEYQAAFREFVSVGDSRSSLSPGTVEKLFTSWDEMRKSEAGLTVALEENPNNPFLNNRMMELRSRQLQFLKQIAALEQNSRRISI